MKQCLDRLGEEKVDRAYFHSAEFQTLLYLLLERLHATHDTEKLRMFGNALANAGNVDFQSNPKEDYVRVLRDLSLRDLQVLHDENLKGWRPHLPHISFEYGPEILASLYRLQGMGLVIGKMMPREAQPGRTGNSRVDGINALSDVITQPPKTTFYLSEFGTRFLQYLSLEAPAQS